MPVHLTCRVCGKTYSRPPTKVRSGVCSSACRYAPPPYLVETRGAVDVGLLAICARDGSIRGRAIVDLADAEWANQWRWSLNGRGHVYRFDRSEEPPRVIYLHRQLLGLSDGDGIEGDHINRDKLDNRRGNLRSLPEGANQQNVPARGGLSPYRGVSFDARRGKWTASVKAGGRKHGLGYYASESEAAEAARAGRARLMPYAVD